MGVADMPTIILGTEPGIAHPESREDPPPKEVASCEAESSAFRMGDIYITQPQVACHGSSKPAVVAGTKLLNRCSLDLCTGSFCCKLCSIQLPARFSRIPI